ncbi:DUF559 domain-containing protein [bacterium]|nr:DUF559 domain-containing protein [bacterium]
MKIHYDPKLKTLSRKLRNQSTLSEVLLWQKLRAKQIKGFQFMRQKPIDKYIVDFYCSKLKLVIEIDGYSHAFEEAFKKDVVRQKYLESLGLTVLRFNDKDVKQNLDDVVRTIEGWIETGTTP